MNNFKTFKIIEKILLAVDQSLSCEGAIKGAFYLSKTFNHKVYVISVAKELPLEEMTDIYPLEAMQKIEQKTLEYLKSIEGRFKKENIVCERNYF
ncbi:MAG: universal stress protein [bacterium]